MGRCLFFILLFCCLSISVLAKQPSPAMFAKGNQYYSVKISPTGEYLALGILFEGKRRLAILDAKTFKPIEAIYFQHPQQVGPFYWANDERLVIKMLEARAWESEPLYYGELYAVNYDGKRGKTIFGYSKSPGSVGITMNRRSNNAWADIEHFLPDDERNILISSEPMSKDGKRLAELRKLNIYTGKMGGRIARSPVPGASFSLDQSGQVRYVVGKDEDGDLKLYQFDQEEEEWAPFTDISIGTRFGFLAFDQAGENVFYLHDGERDTLGLYRFNVAKKESKHIFTDDNVDITDFEYTETQDAVYAMRIDHTYPEYLIFNKQEEEAAIFRSLLATFAGLKVDITSSTKDGSKWIVNVSSDTSPGAYYLFDRNTNKIRFLFSTFNGVDEEHMSAMQPVSIAASDGMTIPGYLTLPKAGPSPAPLVTLVHGGPHGVRDYWGFDREVQMLASQGYAVLQVNYRGSDGYGREFKQAGMKRWGDRIQQDIIEMTQWAMAQPEIDDNKACIMGASFGAYSALQSSILANDLFRCAIANAGIYDLSLLYEEGDVADLYFGEAYLESTIGLEPETLRDFSPVFNVDKLQAPVLIAHGELDRRAPFEHAEDLREALEKANKPFEWFVRSSETHGFHDEVNRGEYYEKVAAFLAKHLK